MNRLALGMTLAASTAVLGCLPAGGQTATIDPAPAPPIQVYFSPGGGATDAIVRAVQAAQTSVLVQAYSFTSVPIAQALVNSHRRGVKVDVILDRSKVVEEKHSQVDLLVSAGLTPQLDGSHGVAHNKLLVIDGQVVVTGSFNFTKHSEQDNAENLLVIRDRPLAEKYTANWKSHAAHSEPYQGRPRAAVPRDKASAPR